MSSIVEIDKVNELRRVFRGTLMQNEPMKNHTSFRIGGPADILVEPDDLESLKNVLRFAHDPSIPLSYIGNGSNLLVKDSGIRGIVVKVANGFDWMTVEGTQVTAGAGISLPKLVRECASRGLSGLEFAAGIPGTLGGAVSMNAGAYGRVISDVLKQVKVLDLCGNEEVKVRDEMSFRHRESRLSSGDMIAIEAELELEVGDASEINLKIAEYMNSRRSKQPLDMPSAGCAFRNPDGNGAGRYIDMAGLKGTKVGDAQVSLIHANFIVNTGEASCEDVIELMDVVKKTVLDKFGVSLVPEVRIMGE